MWNIWSFFHYLANLEWREVRKDCVFCDRSKFESNIVHEDDNLIAINNIRNAGMYHWIIMPKSHDWRDIEGLEPQDAHLVQSMIKVKKHLLEKHCPMVSPTDVHTGFHRGRRVLLGDIYWPDIISIHHLHMHVIVEPQFWLKFFKYPPWLSLMWKSEEQVERELNGKQENDEPWLFYFVRIVIKRIYKGNKSD
ncbi:HIT-like protein [Annulohypoxylon truncatum]|uniref:HIT-like protein n=1 Tax=Annulohypoxylon truncatum TaxID=327061 RepID=UPI00200825B2|nr:HIT-like protein [Annulohypoxylon truncatum]KAI1206317.1 HIT-like protein [Annulohypoxylon truncatum]